MQTRRRVRASRRRKAATAQDIINPNAASVKVPTRFKGAYKELNRFRDYLLARQRDLEKDASEEQPSYSQHIADAGTDSYDRDLALSLLSSERDALYEVEQALHRIRSGTYGICELTGKKIERERLQAIPWTRFCAAAERQVEGSEEHRSPRLQPRDTVAREAATSSEEEVS